MSAQQAQHDQGTPTLRVFVCATPESDERLQATAEQLSVDLNLPLVDKPHEQCQPRQPSKQGVDVLLVVTESRLELHMIGGDPLTRGGRPLYADLAKLDVSTAMGKRVRQPIGKAIGLRDAKDARPTVIDCTAGWGEDSWLLAGLGCRVLAVERNPIVAALLRDGLRRVAGEQAEVASRITLVQANAIDLLDGMLTHDDSLLADVSDMPDLLQPDVVFLDPMFPPRRKGAEGKPMKVLRQLVGGDTDAAKLLDLARQVARRRVVVKRPLHGEPVGGRPPAVTHKGKSVRYDIYPAT